MTEHLAIRPVICPECPFHARGYGARLGRSLDSERRREIADSLTGGTSFPCHMEASGEIETGPAGRMCNGAATIMDREGNPPQVMQLAERLGEPPYTPAETVPWQTIAAWANQQGEG